MNAASELLPKCNYFLENLCVKIRDRSVGSDGNRLATTFFENELKNLGWESVKQEFNAVDWKEDGATLNSGKSQFEVFVSPYSLGCSVEAVLVGAQNYNELCSLDCKGKILFLHGEIAKEQLMPKNFPFYNPDEHQRIISQLENSGAVAIICATNRNPALAGGVYPFPLIEDGDFNVPSVYMTDEEGKRLIPFLGRKMTLVSNSKRIEGKGYNCTGKIGNKDADRIVITAHIDSKKGTPGAIDNASGVTILLLLANLLRDYNGNKQIELVALNGEDYYGVPGQLSYITANQDQFDNILLNVNIDGAGYKTGNSVFSFFNLPEMINKKAGEVLKEFPTIVEGIQWPQGDHSIFVQFGRPAIAVSSQWFTENIESQDITHTSKDTIDIVDLSKLVELAQAINLFVRKL